MEKDCTVFSNERYVLGQKNGLPYITVNGEEYKLTCHPYEPCLYITDKDGRLTAVHNAFDPSSVLESFSEGKTVTSITGTRYDALDFCRMVEYAAGKYDLQIDDAEKVFGPRENTHEKKATPDKKAQEKKADAAIDQIDQCPESDRVIEDDAFYDLIEKYPDCVVDYCLVKNENYASGYNAHRSALLRASRKLFIDVDGSTIWHYDADKADTKQISAGELFAPAVDNGKLNYRKAFLKPPYPTGYTDSDFDLINEALFPNGTSGLEVYEWTTDWSEYFDEGHEWWGALCLTVYDKTLDRFAVIMASATD